MMVKYMIFPMAQYLKIILNCNLFANSQKIRIRLVGEGFKNCVLKDVSGAFSRSGVFGVIPYRLFFMVDSENKLRRTIENMENVFNGC